LKARELRARRHLSCLMRTEILCVLPRFALFSHNPFTRQVANPYECGSSNVESARFWPLSCKTHGHASVFVSWFVSVPVDSSWNVMAHGDARVGKWRGNWRVEWITSTLHTTSEHGVSSITTAGAPISATSTRLNRRPRRFKWTRPFRRKTKYGFCACAITFQLSSTSSAARMRPSVSSGTRTSGQNTYGWNVLK